MLDKNLNMSLREKYLNTEFFLVRIEIQAYIDGIATADKDETAELTQKLIEGISNITTELTCLSYELALLQHSAT